MKTLLLAVLLAVPCWAQALPSDLSSQIDEAAQKFLKNGGPPSLVVGIVRQGKPVFARAYGLARLDPEQSAQPEMRYAIGSVSKQFTVSALLLLQEQGKLSLDDPVSRYFPNLNHAHEITLKQLLSHTSGYSDYYPQDYLPASMIAPIRPEQIVQNWAGRPLDFEPGTRWQYSNTNYVLAGMVIEKVSGMPLGQFLRQQIFTPLGMPSASSEAPEPAATFRYAGGPLRVTGREGPGWLFATGDLAMNVHDLLRWDASFMAHRLLKDSSHQIMEREVLSADGAGTGYALGLFVARQGDQRTLSHGGEVAGFTCENLLLPEEGCAVAVLSNQMATPVPQALAAEISNLLARVSDDAALARHRQFFEHLGQRQIDSKVLSDNARKFFTPEVENDYATALETAGPLQSFVLTRRFRRGGMIGRTYRVATAQKRFAVSTFSLADEKLEQFLLIPLP